MSNYYPRIRVVDLVIYLKGEIYVGMSFYIWFLKFISFSNQSLRMVLNGFCPISPPELKEPRKKDTTLTTERLPRVDPIPKIGSLQLQEQKSYIHLKIIFLVQ